MLASELAVDMTSLSWLAASLDSVTVLYFGCGQFELDLLLPISIVIAVQGVVISVGTWSSGASLAPAGGVVPPASQVGTSGGGAGSSWWKMTWYWTSSASMDAALFSPMLVMVLGEVWNLGLPLYGVESKSMLHHSAEGQLFVQSRPDRQNLQSFSRMQFVVSGCLQYLQASQRFGQVSKIPCLGQP